MTSAAHPIHDLMSLAGKTAVVTGGAGHLGFEITHALLELGADVLVIGRSEEKAAPLADEFGDRIRFHKADLNDRDQVLALDGVMPRRLDVLVNNALTWPANPRFEEAEWDAVSATLTSGVTSPIILTRLAFERMKASGGGVILNNASMYGMVSPNFRIYRDSGMSNAIQYNAAKAAIIQITKYLAVKGAPHNIRVNAFSPGPFSPPGAFNGKEWFHEELIQMMPMKRIGQKWEIKGVIAFLATDLSSYVTGQNVPVDGGWTIW
jgi:NAD(P)-dependent dehydrogenase (short-subunit alcohol dehydrogenase family)